MATNKHLRLVILTIILTLGISIGVEASRIPRYVNGNIYDELNVISGETLDIVDSVNLNMSNNKEFKGAQIMIATIEDLDGRPAFDYSVDFFNKITIGNSKEDNGVLILLAKDNSKNGYNVEVRTGYGLEGILNDGKVGRIIDKAIKPSVKEGNLDEGIRQGFLDIANEVSKEYDGQIMSNELEDSYTPTLDEGFELNLGKIIIIALVIIIAVIALLAIVTKNPLFVDLLYIIIRILLSLGGGSSNDSGSNRSGGGGRTGGGGAGRSM